MLQIASQNELLETHMVRLTSIVSKYNDLFRTGLSAGPRAKLPSHKTELFPGVKPVTVKLRNYSKEQRLFLKDFVEKLVHHGMT